MPLKFLNKTILIVLLGFLFCRPLALRAQQSMTGPERPPGVSTGLQPAKTKDARSSGKAVKLIANVPAYRWHRGCGPTALGMVVGYYDAHGFPDLIPGSASTQTDEVNSAIAGNEHYNDYSLPIDNPPNLKKDKSELGEAHLSNCIADFMNTSWSSRSNYWGWSWNTDVNPAFVNYVALKNNGYQTSTNYVYFNSSHSWSIFTNEIDENRPVVLLVDTDGNGQTDHFVTGIGYNDALNLYAIYDTWDHEVHWYSWQKMANGNSWGIYGYSTFEILPQNCPFSATMTFNAGWNIFSTTLAPGQTDIETTFQALIDNASLVKIQDETGNSLENWGAAFGWKNTIGNMAASEGYKIRMNSKDSLKLCGTPVELPFAIPLQSGWNIVGYPHSASNNALEVVQQLQSRGTLLKVQDETGASVEDWGGAFGWQNNIGNFDPGKGYKVKVNARDTLWIRENYPKSSHILPSATATFHFRPVHHSNGVDHMNINLVQLPTDRLAVGDELAVFDGANCVGVVAVQPQHLSAGSISIAASAHDGQGMPGFSEGRPILLKLWKSDQNREYILEPEILRGSPTFVKHESVFASLKNYTATAIDKLNTEQTQLRCFPNPFSNELRIEIVLPAATQMMVILSDPFGRVVKKLTSTQIFQAGRHELSWKGTSDSHARLSAGMYYLHVETDSTILTRKVILSK